MEDEQFQDFFDRYVKDTPPQAYVFDAVYRLAVLTDRVQNILGLETGKVYITTRALKHAYDKRPAAEFDAIMRNLAEVIRFPGEIYENQESKTGTICLCKQIDGDFFLASLELSSRSSEDGALHCVVTSFILRERKRKNYLQKYRLLWKWKGGEPSS